MGLIFELFTYLLMNVSIGHILGIHFIWKKYNHKNKASLCELTPGGLGNGLQVTHFFIQGPLDLGLSPSAAKSDVSFLHTTQCSAPAGGATGHLNADTVTLDKAKGTASEDCPPPLQLPVANRSPSPVLLTHLRWSGGSHDPSLGFIHWLEQLTDLRESRS